MPLVQNPSPGRKLQRGLRLTELPDGILAPELVGVVIVEDFSAPLSDEERGCGGSTDVAAAAAQFATIGLVKLIGQQYDAIVTGAWMGVDVAQTVEVSIPTNGITGMTQSIHTNFLDLDVPGRPASFLGSVSAAAIPARRILQRFTILPSEPRFVPLQVRLGDQITTNAIMLAAGMANTVLRAAFEWVEATPQG